jgi:hypothetical protein
MPNTLNMFRDIREINDVFIAQGDLFEYGANKSGPTQAGWDRGSGPTKGDPMFKRLLICAVLLCLTVLPAGAQIDPQSLVGVWEGEWSVRGQAGQPRTGSTTITISKVENGKVHGQTESMGSRENPTTKWVADVTPTGYSFVSKEGNAITATVDGNKMRIISGRGGAMTTNLVKK